MFAGQRGLLWCLLASIAFHITIFVAIPAAKSYQVSEFLIQQLQKTKVEFQKIAKVVPKPKPKVSVRRRVVRRFIRIRKPVEPVVKPPEQELSPAVPIATLLPPDMPEPEEITPAEVPEPGVPRAVPEAEAPEPTIEEPTPEPRRLAAAMPKTAPKIEELPDQVAGPAAVENPNPGADREVATEPVKLAAAPKAPDPEPKIRVDVEKPGGPPGPGGKTLLAAAPEPKRVTTTPGPGNKAAPALGTPLGDEPAPDSPPPSPKEGGGGTPEGDPGRMRGPVRLAMADPGGTPGEGGTLGTSFHEAIRETHGDVALPTMPGGGGEGAEPGEGGRGSGIYYVVKVAPELGGGFADYGWGPGAGGTGGAGGGLGGGEGTGFGPGSGPGGFASPVGTGPGGTGTGTGPIRLALGIPQGEPGGGQPGVPFLLGGGFGPGSVPGEGPGGWGPGGPGIGMGSDAGKGGPGFMIALGGGPGGPGGGGGAFGFPGPGTGGGPGGPGVGPGGPIAIPGGTGSGGPGLAGAIGRGIGALGLGGLAAKAVDWALPGGAGAMMPGGQRSVAGGGKAAPGGLYVGVAGSFDMPLGVTTADYDADAAGMTNLLSTVRERTNIHVTVQERFVPLKFENIKDTPILHIRGHKSFSFTDEERQALRKYVENGGMIFGEDSHGPFGTCFRKEMKKIFGTGLKALSKEHEVYRAYYVFDEVPEGDMGERYPLEGIQTKDGRTGVLFSRNDYGDSWEGTGAWVQGRNREAAFEMGVNIYSYAVANWNR
ncbi:MAG: DUF4159 domain-containing protein [Armatimonadota bacterium]